MLFEILIFRHAIVWRLPLAMFALSAWRDLGRRAKAFAARALAVDHAGAADLAKAFERGEVFGGHDTSLSCAGGSQVQKPCLPVAGRGGSSCTMPVNGHPHTCWSILSLSAT